MISYFSIFFTNVVCFLFFSFILFLFFNFGLSTLPTCSAACMGCLWQKHVICLLAVSRNVYGRRGVPNILHPVGKAVTTEPYATMAEPVATIIASNGAANAWAWKKKKKKPRLPITLLYLFGCIDETPIRQFCTSRFLTVRRLTDRVAFATKKHQSSCLTRTT